MHVWNSTVISPKPPLPSNETVEGRTRPDQVGQGSRRGANYTYENPPLPPIRSSLPISASLSRLQPACPFLSRPRLLSPVLVALSLESPPSSPFILASFPAALPRLDLSLVLVLARLRRAPNPRPPPLLPPILSLLGAPGPAPALASLVLLLLLLPAVLLCCCVLRAAAAPADGPPSPLNAHSITSIPPRRPPSAFASDRSRWSAMAP